MHDLLIDVADAAVGDPALNTTDRRQCQPMSCQGIEVQRECRFEDIHLAVSRDRQGLQIISRRALSQNFDAFPVARFSGGVVTPGTVSDFGDSVQTGEGVGSRLGGSGGWDVSLRRSGANKRAGLSLLAPSPDMEN